MNTTTVVRVSRDRKHPRLSNISITEGPVWKGLLTFFFPILLGTFFQQLYNTTDAVIVGQFVGKEALAAVGGGTAVYVNLLVGFFVGLSSGATVIISQFYGAKHDREVNRAVHTAVMLAITAGAVMTAAGSLASPWAMTIIGTPEDIYAQSVLYLRIYFYGMIPMFIYNMGSGVLRAVGDSCTPFYILVAGCGANIILDLLFVAVFHQGVAGASWATVLSQTVSMLLVLAVLIRTDDSYRLTLRQLSITPHLLRDMVRIGFPAGIQSVLYTVSNLIIQANINAFGTNTIAAWAAYGRIDSIFWMTSNSFGVALTTFSGQNYGAKLYDRMKTATRNGMAMAAGAAAGYCVLFWFTGRMFFHLFTTDEQVITTGMKMLHFLAPFFITYIPVEVFSGTIRGTGDSFNPMIITAFGVCVLRILWLLVTVPIWPSLITVIACYPVTWTTTSVLFALYYKHGTWINR